MLPASLGALSLETTPQFMDLLALPRALVLAIFALLPVDTRLRCVEVSRAWRALLADTTFFTGLDLSEGSFSEALFRASIAKASGQLRWLNVHRRGSQALPLPTLLDALASNAASLKLLAAPSTLYTSAEVLSLLETAPLSECHLSALADNVELACRYARNKPPYDRLRLHIFKVKGDRQLDSVESLDALCTDLVKHPSLMHVGIRGASLGTATAMRILVNAAIALRLVTIDLLFCGCTRACVPELTRLVSAGVV